MYARLREHGGALCRLELVPCLRLACSCTFPCLRLDALAVRADFVCTLWDVQVDGEGKRASWEGIVKIPFVNEVGGS